MGVQLRAGAFPGPWPVARVGGRAMDYDSAWKQALDVYFRPFLRLLFPAIHDDVDWSRPPEMLDKEFQKLVPRAERGRQTVDKLVKVWRRGGQEAWVLVHVEVQAKRQADFGERMSDYNASIWRRYRRDVASLAVLADDNPGWRPTQFERGLWGCSDRFTFPAVKLLDYEGREEELQASDNPFAKVVLAHVKTLATRDEPRDRKDWRLRIARGLHECGLLEEDVRQLMLLVDWLMELPEGLDREYEQQLREFEEGRHMPYVTSFGRNAMLDLLEAMLQAKFGEEGLALVPVIRELNDAEKYKALGRTIVTATSLDEVRRACAAARAKSGGKGRRAPKVKP